MNLEELDSREPDRVIDLDLRRVMKQSLWLTGGGAAVLYLVSFLIRGEISLSVSFGGFMLGLLLFTVGYVVLIVLHEACHLLGFRIFGGVPFRKMAYGVNLEMGIAYATTEIPLRNKPMRDALLLPLWLTGILPGIIGIWLDSHLLILLSAFLIGGAAGDLEMNRQLRKLPDNWLIRDDPEKPKLYAYDPQEKEATPDEPGGTEDGPHENGTTHES
ncbi:hypothetical protein C772_02522 [Bhargavaea cecembensis DSE10]|uniref:Zincin peptidase n=1 Tax=Bhargavaea cecembensis DSE10 TaxID=1235279 RepID=M7NV58_9BACL|nr:DUF3267 domain-containing protein [Bhargavaea cecembensis]EMR05550.1 hypothetical protein C772_02522 [Bhargavaea cecembensis DSE10]